jgi:hypothetical protein
MNGPRKGLEGTFPQKSSVWFLRGIYSAYPSGLTGFLSKGKQSSNREPFPLDDLADLGQPSNIS